MKARRVLRGVWAMLQRLAGAEAEWRDAGRCGAVPEPLPQPCPETVFLFAELEPEARKAFDVFPSEVRAWRAMAEMEAARARLWSGQGRVWDAGMCAGRAQAYRVAASQIEEALIESLELWEQYERQVGED